MFNANRRFFVAAFVAFLLLFLDGGLKCANALTFNWQFTIDYGTDNIGGLVSGTISGLHEGINSGTGLNISVTSTPTGDLLVSDWGLYSAPYPPGDAFTVNSGVVTYANALYSRLGSLLYFGGSGGYQPELQGAGHLWSANSGATLFTPVSATPLPASLPLFATILCGLGLIGVRRNRTST